MYPLNSTQDHVSYKNICIIFVLQADLGEVMTIVAVATKGRGGKNCKFKLGQWVTHYKLATVVNGHTIYYKGPLADGMVLIIVKYIELYMRS